MRSADLDVRKREPVTPPATPHPHGVIGVDGLEGPGRSRPADAQQFQRLRPHHSPRKGRIAEMRAITYLAVKPVQW